MARDRRAALPARALTRWGNAYLVGRRQPRRRRVCTPWATDALHRVVGVPGEDDAVPVGVALGRLRAAGVTGAAPRAARAGRPARAARARRPSPRPRSPPGRRSHGRRAGRRPVLGAACRRRAGERGRRRRALGRASRWRTRCTPHGLPTLSEAERGSGRGDARHHGRARRRSTSRAAATSVAPAACAAFEQAAARIDLPPTLPARAQRAVVQAARLLGVLDARRPRPTAPP